MWPNSRGQQQTHAVVWKSASLIGWNKPEDTVAFDCDHFYCEDVVSTRSVFSSSALCHQSIFVLPLTQQLSLPCMVSSLFQPFREVLKGGY